MKAAIIHQFGNAEVLQITEVSKPEINDSQVLIKVIAVGINPVDTKVRAGTSGMSKQIKLPAILGWDVSGIIENVGKDISDFKPGDEVFGCIGFPGTGKTYAEFSVADPKLLAKKPNNISFDEAAATPLAALTSYQAINEHLEINAGQKILIQAAAGGVGHLSVQFAKLNGAFVIGTATAKNEKFLKEIGVDQVIDYKKENFENIVHNPDAVIDAMGGKILYRSISCVKPGGTVVCLPSSTKDDPKAIELAKERDVKLIWPMMHPEGGQMQIISGLLNQKKIKVSIDKIFTLDQIVWAHKAVETHQSKGKVVVRIN
ncbi:MAG: NADP-dependent oxidoreductase [Bacteroidota bacterium]|nr:NADP-dependent oxidoreductase [Bacteroidota bacterium]